MRRARRGTASSDATADSPAADAAWKCRSSKDSRAGQRLSACVRRRHHSCSGHHFNGGHISVPTFGRQAKFIPGMP